MEIGDMNCDSCYPVNEFSCPELTIIPIPYNVYRYNVSSNLAVHAVFPSLQFESPGIPILLIDTSVCI